MIYTDPRADEYYFKNFGYAINSEEDLNYFRQTFDYQWRVFALKRQDLFDNIKEVNPITRFLFLNRRPIKILLIVLVLLILWLISPKSAAEADFSPNEQTSEQFPDPCGLKVVVCPDEEKAVKNDPIASQSGLASYYSREGCLGCSENMIMANGQPLDDSAMTVAYNDAPIGSIVTIVNEATKASVTATVTDTGGFKRHGKIIDLTIAVRDALGCGSVCKVEVIHQ